MKIEKSFLSWTTPHRPAKLRTNDWYWMIGTVAIAVAVVSGWRGNILLGVIAILAAFIIMVESRRDKGGEKVSIVKKGIKVGDTLYPVSEIHSFYLDEDDEHPHLSIRLNKPLLPSVEIELGDMDAHKLNDFLAQYLPEEEHEKHLAEHIVKGLGL
ncbi:MAG: hypothetical protein COV07_01140 [Candidatus Vogelbacteria bacterium CG10_big_fil_rev_8_21_14_0_10_45_14]|uniref:DUF5673 domain-containing protein n=1 Tax=Candidatus Vogelbacteria bacterium CG10_big_fil_rev_8_21_14_0_10_45_14 TaxID=1975042 RepID=A0A2H0RKG7_9BACT|nr:MAG: hypothetical protein COV07_01140 [Candidatus Vogelbacteria bacterium CG10_big_fil_rev_8_21_14_0_10_45_14]